MPIPIDRGTEKNARRALEEVSHSFGFHAQFIKATAPYKPRLANSTTRIAKIIAFVVFFIFLNNFRVVHPILLRRHEVGVLELVEVGDTMAVSTIATRIKNMYC